MPRRKKVASVKKPLSPLGIFLERILREKNTNKATFAKLCGLNRSTLHGAMHLEHIPSTDTLRAIASGLSKLTLTQVTMADLPGVGGGGQEGKAIASVIEAANNIDQKLLVLVRESLSSLVSEIDSKLTPNDPKDMTCAFKTFVAESLATAGIKSDRQLDELIQESQPLEAIDQMRIKLICQNRLEPEIQDLPRLAILLSVVTGREVTQQEVVDLINSRCYECHSSRQLQF